MIHLDQPNSEVFVEQEIESKEFKAVMTVAGVHFLLNAEEGVEDDVLYPGQEQIFNVEIVLRKVLVQVLLQVVIVECVSFLMLSVSISFHLEALIGQVHKVVFILQVVGGAAGSQIAVPVEENSEVIRNDSPDPDVELASIEEERVFDVLLHDPGLRLRVLVEDEFVDVLHMPKNFNPATLV